MKCSNRCVSKWQLSLHVHCHCVSQFRTKLHENRRLYTTNIHVQQQYVGTNCCHNQTRVWLGQSRNTSPIFTCTSITYMSGSLIHVTIVYEFGREAITYNVVTTSWPLYVSSAQFCFSCSATSLRTLTHRSVLDIRRTYRQNYCGLFNVKRTTRKLGRDLSCL